MLHQMYSYYDYRGVLLVYSFEQYELVALKYAVEWILGRGLN